MGLEGSCLWRCPAVDVDPVDAQGGAPSARLVSVSGSTVFHTSRSVPSIPCLMSCISLLT